MPRFFIYQYPRRLVETSKEYPTYSKLNEACAEASFKYNSSYYAVQVRGNDPVNLDLCEKIFLIKSLDDSQEATDRCLELEEEAGGEVYVC